VRYDRDELLARTDLGDLADELLGAHTGHGRNARWPSPVPDHPQTGRTPPMSIFTDHRGVQRWTCFATGANGTAIDLVMTATGCSVADAITRLAERARLDRPPEQRRPIPRRDPPPPPRQEPSAAMVAYVDACAQVLWRPDGAPVRDWLIERRGLDPDVLRRNRVGADPGPARLRRPYGLPRHGPAAVFPALDDTGRPVYLQARYLHPPADRGKYDNPAARHAANPRVALAEPARTDRSVTVVTEGIPDALAAATGGYRAIAVLGASAPDGRVARAVAGRAGAVALAFDADPAGRAGAARLTELLAGLGRDDVVDLTPPAPDLNAWLLARGAASFRDQLDLSIRLAAPRQGRGIGRSIA